MKRLQIRLPDTIHERVSKLSKQDKVSMNQFMVTAISNEIIRQETHAFFKERSSFFNEADFLQALDEVPDVTPDKRDRIGSSNSSPAPRNA